MSKNSSAFGSFTDAAVTNSTPHSIYTTKHDQLTVDELIRILQTIVRKDPSSKDAPVWHVEFGSLTPSRFVETHEEGVVISGSRY